MSKENIIAYTIRETVSGNYYTILSDTPYNPSHIDMPSQPNCIALGPNRQPHYQFDMWDEDTQEYWDYWIVARIEIEDIDIEDLPIITPHPIITEDS